ncbi:hypothetical protein K438DRAFT_1773399 [Mycena galopus ATCC 62051]|nr:hypothetical protein K438DRAFT_1773399 [Mycena galopus ATCC 62051]
MSAHLTTYQQMRKGVFPDGKFSLRNLSSRMWKTDCSKLRDVWARKIGDDSKAKRIEVLDDLSKMTLDVIGQAGFDYQFDSLNPDKGPNEVYEAFEKLMHSPHRSRGNTIRSTPIPLLRLLALIS